MSPFSLALLTDFYELTMAQAYWRGGVTGQATFSLFIRGYPADRAYYVAAGLADALAFLEGFCFTDDDIDYLRSQGGLDSEFLNFLARLRFTGSVRAIPEGSLCFANEPLIEVTAPVIESQVVETYLLNQFTFQTTLATKASRVAFAARDRSVVDFAARRTHGIDAADKVARAGYIAGYAATSNVHAAAIYGLEPVGTMAHSYIMAFENELEAFRAYAAAFPDAAVLLVDTYDTIAGVQNAATVGQEMASRGHTLQGIRLDSGDMGALAKESRRILDEAGLTETRIVASGGLDEFEVDELLRRNAPIDSFGVGTKAGVSADAPYLDSAYKLVEYEGRPVLKLSSAKRTLPGPKQVYRLTGGDGHFKSDTIATADEPRPEGSAEPLLVEVMQDGRRVAATEPLDVARDRFKQQFAMLSPSYKALESPKRYEVSVSEQLRTLEAEVSQRVARS